MTMKNHARHGVLLAVVLVSSFVLSACVGGYGEKTTPSTDVKKETTETTKKEVAQTNAITIQNMGFGATVTVKAGSTVTVTNKDAAGHSVTSDDGTSFDTGVISKDKTTQFTAPTKPGTYTFHCTPHPSMKGTLIVQ